MDEPFDKPCRRAAHVKVDRLNDRDHDTNRDGDRLRRRGGEYGRERQNGILWMVQRPVTGLSMLAWQMTDRVRLRVLVDDDPGVAVCLSLVPMLRRDQGHDAESGGQSQ